MISVIQYNSSDLKKNAWVTVNNDFWVTSEAICQWFLRVTWSRVRITGKSPQKSLFTVRNVLFYSLHSILYPKHTIPWKTLSITHFVIDGLFWFSIVTHHSWSVTSNERGGLALWRHIRRLFFHVQTGTKVNNNHEYWFLTTRYSRLSV